MGFHMFTIYIIFFIICERSDIYKPHFIFTQTFTYNEKDDVDSEHVKLSDGGEEMINIESPSDFIFTNHCSAKDIVFIKSHKNRDFSNLMIVTSKNCIIHNIYMHQKNMSTKNKCQPKTNFNQKQMSTKKNVNQKQMSSKNKCKPKTNVNQKQMSTKNKCQPKTNVHQKQMSTNTKFQSNVNPKQMSTKNLM